MRPVAETILSQEVSATDLSLLEAREKTHGITGQGSLMDVNAVGLGDSFKVERTEVFPSFPVKKFKAIIFISVLVDA